MNLVPLFAAWYGSEVVAQQVLSGSIGNAQATLDRISRAVEALLSRGALAQVDRAEIRAEVAASDVPERADKAPAPAPAKKQTMYDLVERYVVEHPGCIAREIAQALGTTEGNIQSRLTMLKDRGKLFRMKGEKPARVFATQAQVDAAVAARKKFNWAPAEPATQLVDIGKPMPREKGHGTAPPVLPGSPRIRDHVASNLVPPPLLGGSDRRRHADGSDTQTVVPVKEVVRLTGEPKIPKGVQVQRAETPFDDRFTPRPGTRFEGAGLRSTPLGINPLTGRPW